MKRAEILERNRIAVDFIEKNRHLSREELVEYLVAELHYTKNRAQALTSEKPKKTTRIPAPLRTGKGLKVYLDKQEAEEQKKYERKMLEKELDRPKFFF